MIIILKQRCANLCTQRHLMQKRSRMNVTLSFSLKEKIRMSAEGQVCVSPQANPLRTDGVNGKTFLILSRLRRSVRAHSIAGVYSAER